MERPQPVPGPEPEHQPPPYSGLFSSKYREYTPIAIPMPWPYDTATGSNPVNQGLPENEIPMPQPPPVIQEGTRNQSDTFSSMCTDCIIDLGKRCCVRLCISVVTTLILVALAAGGYIRVKPKHKTW